jgi:general secretion pathway protein E
MQPTKIQSNNHSLLPYDFVRVKSIIALEDNDGCKIFSQEKISIEIYHELSRYLNRDFELEICDSEQFNQLLTKVFSTENNSAEFSDELNESFDLKTFANSIAPTEDLLSGSDDVPIIKLINGIISQAIKQRASDIHFEPYEDLFIIRYRIDGILKEVLSQDSRIAPLVISRIKIISRLDISERRLPQDGRVSLSLGNKRVDVRVSTLPSTYGERIVLRLLDKQSAQISIQNLGLENNILKNYQATLKASEGIILVTGPTGSGKTTTLYAGLRYLSDASQNILTVEDPIEYTLKGVGQTQVNSKTGYDFAMGLRSMLRQDPDIVMVGEIRDQETARIAIQASLTGHLVLSTVHTNSAVGAITRLRDMGIEPFLLSSSLKTIISQRLARRLCRHCKQENQLTRSMAELFGIKAGTTVFDPKGCDHCDGTGYVGRIAVAESIQIDTELKNMMHEAASEQEIAKYAFQHNLSIDETGRDLIIAGITSAEELIRINNQKDDASL